MSPFVELTFEGPLARLTMKRADKLNALDRAMVDRRTRSELFTALAVTTFLDSLKRWAIIPSMLPSVENSLVAWRCRRTVVPTSQPIVFRLMGNRARSVLTSARVSLMVSRRVGLQEAISMVSAAEAVSTLDRP